MDELTQSDLQELLSYDPATGVFTRRARTAQRVRVGDVAGGISSQGYRYIKILGRSFRASRLAWLYVHGAWPLGTIDHINGNRGDDRIANLRDCASAENSQNRRNPKGVYWCGKRRRYTSVVMISGVRHYLGRFKTAAEARQAYVDAKSKLHPFQNMSNLRT
jgi:hypothetical protein